MNKIKTIMIWVITSIILFIIYSGIYFGFYIVLNSIFNIDFKTINVIWLLIGFVFMGICNYCNSKRQKKIEKICEPILKDIQNFKENDIYLHKKDYNYKIKFLKDMQKYFVKKTNEYFKENNINYESKIYKNGYVKITKEK